MPDLEIHGDQHIKNVPLTPLSILSPYSALILSIVLVILFLIKQYIFDAFLLQWLYREKYTALNDVARRGFLNHHIAGGMKALILVVGVYPFIDVAFRCVFHFPLFLALLPSSSSSSSSQRLPLLLSFDANE